MDGAPVLIAVRLVEYLSASILFGAPLFSAYGRSSDALQSWWGRRVRAQFEPALVLGVATIVWVAIETAAMSGDPAQATDPSALLAFLTETPFGWVALARLLACGSAVALAIGTGGRWKTSSWLSFACGAVALASLAWNGHGAADEGPRGWVHLAADILHLLSAGAWIGALLRLTVLLFRSMGSASPDAAQAAADRLVGFSGVGTAIVAILALSGAVNGWLLVGPAHAEALLNTNYGRLLLAKLMLFGAMLGFAVANRFLLTPRLAARLATASDPGAELVNLRRSLIIETALGCTVLAAVAWLGTMMPPMSMT